MTSLLTKIENFISAEKKIIVKLGSAELKIAMSSTLGVAVTAAIKAGEAGTTAPEKIALGIASLAPTLVTLAADPAAAIEDIETTAKLIIEAALAQIKTTGPLAIIEALIEAVM